MFFVNTYSALFWWCVFSPVSGFIVDHSRHPRPIYPYPVFPGPKIRTLTLAQQVLWEIWNIWKSICCNVPDQNGSFIASLYPGKSCTTSSRVAPFALAGQLCTEFGEVCRHHTAFKVAGDFISASIGIRKSIATSTVTSGAPSPEAPHYTPFQCLFHVVAAALNWKLRQTTSRHHWRGRWQLLNPHVEQRGVLKYPSQTIREPK